MEANTTSLRGSAAQWSLAGDKQLLDILQNIHQSLVTRCQEVNRKLDEMVTALDGASVDLQNVNNKFMALSNSQFIESRVYDDDVDVAATGPPKEAPKPSQQPPQDLEQLKHSIRVLESTHEIIEILDSDTDDSEDEEITRTVLKPRDMYGQRPLPHVIGSQHWRNKWHAGLHPEDSDSDSSCSAPAQRDQYSDSEPEEMPPRAPIELEGSLGSSEPPSELEARAAAAPADVAAALARRLGGQPPIPAPEPEYSPPKMSQKVYRPDQPSVGTVFCDEPPPLDQYESDEDLPDEEDDIFAELHKSKPSSSSNRGQSRVAEDLFGPGVERGDIFNDFRDDKVTSTPVAKKSTLFENEPEPELFANSRTDGQTQEARRETRAAPQDTTSVKKPVGGISLFGNNKGAESIGAAILKRNQRQSSEDESDSVPPQIRENTPPKSKEKDIFDDLFAKSEREQKMKEKKKEKIKESPKAVAKEKVDLFSDNIFDDIDDIFAGNISTVNKKEKKDTKPLFDDDDDLFSDIAVSKESKVDVKSSKKKSIFDSDDDLFVDTIKKQETNESSRSKEITKVNTNEFDDLDDIFSDIVKSNDSEVKSNVVNVVAEEITRTASKGSLLDNNVARNEKQVTIANQNSNLLANNDKTSNVSESNNLQNRGANNNIEKSTKSLFSDENDDELFAKNSKKPSTSDENSNIVNSTKPKNDDKSSKAHQKSSLFDDDSDENDLFGSSAKNDQNSTDFNKKSVKNDTVASSSDNVHLQKSSIFEDDETEDIFTSDNTNTIITNKLANKDHIVSNANNGGFENNQKTSNSNNKSLFGDDDLDDSNLFGNNDKKTKEETKLLGKNEHPPLNQPTLPIKEQNHKKENSQPLTESIQKPILQQKPIINNEKPILEQQNEQKPQSQEPSPTKAQSGLFEYEKPVITQQTPIIIDEKPTLLQKPQMNQEKPPAVEKLPSETVNNKSNDALANQVEIEPTTVDSKIPLDKDNNTKEETIKTSTEFTPKQESSSTTDLTDKPIEYKIPDLDLIDAQKPLEEKDPLFSQSKDTLLSTPAVFDDIFSEPPAFEKSSEPKKSKNVNALFDDDSDDEALFFKKSDATLDEKPDLSPDANRDALFGIFHDEPPAIDIDFIQKTTKSNFDDDLLKSDSDDDLFTIKNKKDAMKPSQNAQKYLVPDDSTKTIKAEEIIPKSQLENIDTATKSTPVIDKAEIFEHKSKTEPKSPNTSTDSDTKKVGKLKTMNFNIDVSTLLPGASPKKKAIEQTDGQAISVKSNEDIHTDKDSPKTKRTDEQIFSTKSNEDLHTKDKVEPSILKSVSFEGEPDSNILDNKLSKERAKIQVKRRPSTRRARKEAVRKSAIDLPDDSTDNSSSIDDPPKFPKSKPKSRIEPEKAEPTHNPNESTQENISTPIDTVPQTTINPEIDQTKPEKETEISKSVVKESIDTTDSKQIDEPKSIASSVDIRPKEEEFTRKDSKKVTSKIVYVLNDEDIFTNPTIENPQKSKVLNIVDDDEDDLFRNISKNTGNVSGISTLGNAYKDIASDIHREVRSTIESQSKVDSQIFADTQKKSTLDSQKTNISNVRNKPSQSKSDSTSNDSKKLESKNKKSLFDDLSDEESELFASNKKPASKVKSILDSDSEDDLFGGRKKETKDIQPSAEKTKDVKPKVEVKGSLFGDEDDDDDLFGVKVKTNVVASNPPLAKAKEVAPRSSEPVFDDPLSLLGGDD